MPRIDDIMDGLGRARYFSVLDLYSGFHQIPLEEDSKDVTSFSTENGSYRFNVLPFGLSVAPNSFSRMMSLAFAGLTPSQCFLYMDDLIVIGCSEEHHLQNLKSVFETCRRYNLKLNPEKCQFFRPEVTYLGHKCTNKGVRPDSSKLEALQKYPVPEDRDAVRRFVAFANYYRRFIPDFAKWASPLNYLTRKKVIFKWTKEAQESFDYLRQSLISQPILQYPDFSKPFVITVDASNVATGAILSQDHDGEDLPVSYASRAFTKGEKNKSTIEKELLAVHFAIKHFRPYVYGTRFTVNSDHRPLVYLFGLKDPSSRLTRIRLDLEEYAFVIHYIKGKTNVGADALSRITIEQLKAMTEVDAAILTMMTRSKTNRNTNEIRSDDDLQDETEEIRIYESLGGAKTNEMPRLKFENINEENESEPRMIITRKRKRILEKVLPTTRDANGNSHLDVVFSLLEAEADRLRVNKLQMMIDDQLISAYGLEEFKKKGNEKLKKLKIEMSVVAVPVEDVVRRTELLTIFHDDPILGGHVGQKRMYAKLRTHYYWKNMAKDVARFVRGCAKCQRNKVKPGAREPLVLTNTPQRPFDRLIVDTIGPFTGSATDAKYALTAMCDLSKYLIMTPLVNKEATTVARALLKDVVLVYGPMGEMLTDMGTEFRNQTVSELLRLLNTRQSSSTAYHHETLGTVERSHRVFNEYLRAYVDENHDDWEEYIKYFQYCYNTTPHTSLGRKYTPYELVFGKRARTLDFLARNCIDPVYNVDSFAKEAKYRLQLAHRHARALLDESKKVVKGWYDRTARGLRLTPGDRVLMVKEDRNKREPVYDGPFEVIRVEGVNVVMKGVTGKEKTVHKNRVRKYLID